MKTSFVPKDFKLKKFLMTQFVTLSSSDTTAVVSMDSQSERDAIHSMNIKLEYEPEFPVDFESSNYLSSPERLSEAITCHLVFKSNQRSS